MYSWLSMPCWSDCKVLLLFIYFDDEGQAYNILFVCSSLQPVGFSCLSLQ